MSDSQVLPNESLILDLAQAAAHVAQLMLAASNDDRNVLTAEQRRLPVFDLEQDEINNLYLTIISIDATNVSRIMVRRLLSIGGYGTDDFDYFPTDQIYSESELLRMNIVRKAVNFINGYTEQAIANHEDLCETCAICFSRFKMGESLRKLTCTHKFHRSCIDQWLVRKYNCPICRKDMVGDGKDYSGISFLYNSNANVN